MPTNKPTRTDAGRAGNVKRYLVSTNAYRYTTPIDHGLVCIDDRGVIVGGINDGMPVEDLGDFYLSDIPISENLDELFNRLRREREDA